MCTVSWCRAPGAYEIFFNRDEKRTRLLASPPALQRRDGIDYLAPRDASRGGTWLAVNALGLTLGLLNAHPDPAPRSAHLPLRSRGLLVRDLISSHSLADAAGELKHLDLGAFSPFTLIGADLDDGPRAWTWDGRRLQALPQPLAMPLSSSSFESAAAVATRTALFADMQAAHGAPAAWLDAYHRSHMPEKGAYSVCMHRPDAHTVSYSRLQVTDTEARFTYQAGAPCEGRAPVVATLPMMRRRRR